MATSVVETGRMNAGVVSAYSDTVYVGEAVDVVETLLQLTNIRSVADKAERTLRVVFAFFIILLLCLVAI